MPKVKRIGIFRGTFDPIHLGHIEFAKSSLELAKLDSVYFLVEPNPIHKKEVSDLSNRSKAVDRTLKSCQNLYLLKGEHFSGSIGKIMPMLKRKFKNDQLVFLMGSDIAKTLGQWTDLEQLFKNNELVIGLRVNDDRDDIENLLDSLKYKPKNLFIIQAPVPKAASSKIRKATGSQ